MMKPVERAGTEVSTGDRAAVATLSATALAKLRPFVEKGQACALLDFPNYGNVGDSAIWLGERALLGRLGARVSYATDPASFRADRLRASVGSGPIFLQGGGNLGDLWPELQAFREEVIAAFPDNPIVQLPQSIHFTDRQSLERARRVFAAHPRFTLLVRDRRSLAIAREELARGAELCPDMAFGLGPLRPSRRPVDDVVSLVRRDDREAAGARAGIHAAHGLVVDWSEDDDVTARWRGRIRRVMRPRLLRGSWRHAVHVYDALARWRLQAGVRLLSGGRVVLTDRLHGHILCVLLGIPHVAMDNAYGKISSFIDTWTSGLPFVRFADSPERARSLVRELLEDRA
jgi:exopolysaccharide biosynthesis predicted pyruvyltransferase EpsI